MLHGRESDKATGTIACHSAPNLGSDFGAEPIYPAIESARLRPLHLTLAFSVERRTASPFELEFPAVVALYDTFRYA